MFLVTLTLCTLRARKGVVQDSETSVYKMHKKNSESSTKARALVKLPTGTLTGSRVRCAEVSALGRIWTAPPLH